MHRREVLAVEQDAPRLGPTQLQHRAAERGLAAAGFADQPKRLAARHFQTDVGHRVDGLAADGIFDDEVFHLEKRIARRGLPGILHHASIPAGGRIGWKQANW